MAVSENGQFLAVVNEKGNLYVWQAKTAQSASHGFIPLASIKSAHSPYAIKCAFSPNSEYFKVNITLFCFNLLLECW